MEQRIYDLENGGGGGGATHWDYSTSEVATGQKWINEKDIYSRVFNNLNKSLSDWTDLGVDASDIDTIVNGYVIGNDSGKGQCMVNAVIFAVSSNKLWVLKQGSFAGTIETAVVFYTKSSLGKNKRSKK